MKKPGVCPVQQYQDVRRNEECEIRSNATLCRAFVPTGAGSSPFLSSVQQIGSSVQDQTTVFEDQTETA